VGELVDGGTDHVLRRVDRRQFLALAGAASGSALLAGLAGAPPASASIDRAAAVPPAGSDLGAIDHVIFLMLENRSFDHYYGTYPGVRGFDDHPPHHLGAFSQAFAANTSKPPTGRLLPFHLDTVHSDIASCTFDLSHEWNAQHQAFNNGTNDSFVKVHTSTDNEGLEQGVLTMGYYTRADLPYYYALADAFTICDGYHCSVLGPTDPNRMMQISGTIDPSGTHGGPITYTVPGTSPIFSVSWDTMPEVLEDAGISWKYYRANGDLYTIETMKKVGITIDGTLPFFKQYQDPNSALYQKAFMSTFDDFTSDVRHGTLPAVSWMCTPAGYNEHPPSPSFLGEWFTDQVLKTLVSNPKVWSKTVLFHMYDENDGFFDHVPPPVAPPGTPGEYLTMDPLPALVHGIAGPIGLGFRVPMLVVSPFSRGGYVCSQTFDHTSQLRFLEERFGVKAPNISKWRRKTVGDLTGTLHMNHAVRQVPRMPATTNSQAALTAENCSEGDILGIATDQPPYPVPAKQRMPRQERGRARRVRRSGR
jgi:phospholipase C